ncbi:hypothetical protein D3C71_1902480 [compost metagenome]
MALIAGSGVQRAGVGPNRFDIVDQVAFLYPGGGLQFAPLRTGGGYRGFFKRLGVFLHFIANGRNKNAFARQQRKHALAPLGFCPAHDLHFEPIAVTF